MTPEALSATSSLRTASLPKLGYTVDSNGYELYDVSTSVDFELPDHYVPDLVSEVAKMIGVNLRKEDIYQYANAEQLKN